MKTRTIISIMVAAVMTSCNLESDNCPKVIQVPFERVEIPDSVEVDQAFTIDVNIYDYGCYEECTVIGSPSNNIVYLTAYANYDNCGCPTTQAKRDLSYIAAFDSSARNSARYYIYEVINNNQDTIYTKVDTVWVY